MKLKYIRLIISALLFIIVLSFLKWNDIGNAILKSNIKILIFAFCLHIIGLLISVVRWDVLLRAVSIEKSIGKLLIIYWVSLFYNLFLPTSIGGDLVRVYDLNRSTGKLEGSIASVVMDRLTGMIVLLFIALGAMVLNVRLYNQNLLLWTIIFLVCFIIFFFILIFSSSRKLLYYFIPSKILGFIQKKMEQVLNAFSYYRTNMRVLVIALIWGIMLQLNVIFYYYLIGRSLGIKLDFVHYCVAVPIIQVITLIPVSLSGVGVREAATITIFAVYNVSSELAFSLSILGFILALIFNAFGGLFQAKVIKEIEV